jgi:hypothetical protein
MARYLKQTRDLFLHIPRTGGTTVGNVLFSLGIKTHNYKAETPIYLPRNHSLIWHHLRAGETHDLRYLFAFVREPLAYYKSTWKWMKQSHAIRGEQSIPSRQRWHPFKSVFGMYSSDFNEWFGRVLVQEPAWYTRLLESYLGPEGGEFVDFIGRTETLFDDLHLVLNAFGYKVGPINDFPRDHVIEEPIELDSCLVDKMAGLEVVAYKRFYGGNFGRRWHAELVAREAQAVVDRRGAVGQLPVRAVPAGRPGDRRDL